MPYIKKEDREKYEPHIKGIEYIFEHTSIAQVAGEFTYIVYRLLKRFNVTFYFRALGIGCMVCAILEMYRQHHAVYERQKQEENGDV